MNISYQGTLNNVEFISIACDDKETSWLATIAKYQLPWINLIDNNNSSTNTPVKYAVEAYPEKFIISPQGTLTHVFQGEGEDFYTALDKLFK